MRGISHGWETTPATLRQASHAVEGPQVLSCMRSNLHDMPRTSQLQFQATMSSCRMRTALCLQAVALAGLDGQGPDARRRRIRAELMRWHPDKFAARLAQRLQPGAAQHVSERVKLTSQVLNSLSQPVQKA